MAAQSPFARSPIWIPIVRGIQILLSLAVLGLSGDLIHGLYFNALGFAIVCVIFTWLVTAYNLATEFIASLSSLRIELAIIGADALLVVFWLSSMAAVAALRAEFKYNVNVEGCYNNGQAIDSSTCVVDRGLEKRAVDAVASYTGLDMMSGIAGLSALEMLLFIACLVYYVLSWYQGRRSKTSQAGYEGYSTATNQQQPYVQPPQPQQQPYSQQQYTPQQPPESYSMPTTYQPYGQQTQPPQQPYMQQQYGPQQHYG